MSDVLSEGEYIKSIYKSIFEFLVIKRGMYSIVDTPTFSKVPPIVLDDTQTLTIFASAFRVETEQGWIEFADCSKRLSDLA